MTKQSSLTNAKSIVGTCPDMCPEKERYRREDTRRLSWFEVDRETYEPRVSRREALLHGVCTYIREGCL